MDGHSFGKAMSGIAMMAGFGIVCAILIWLFATPALLIGIIHLVSRMATGEWFHARDFGTLYSLILMIWLAFHGAASLILWWRERRKERKHEAEHADFMRLRKKFYRDNEVCLDSYEMLKRRAGEA